MVGGAPPYGDAMAFTGIPAQAFQFYADLELDNSRSFWEAHRSVYEEAVRAPLSALVEELSTEFGPGRLFRPYRDVRFSADKSPYKDHQGAYVEVGPSCGYYVQVDSNGIMVAGGWYASASDQLARYRAVVAGPGGPELAAIAGALPGCGLRLGGERLKTKPRGVPADHPMIELLRHRTVTVETRHEHTEPWLGTPAALDRVRHGWRCARPLIEWLADNVTGRQEA